MRKGQTMSDAQKKLIGDSHRGTKSVNFGKPLPMQTRLRMSATLRGLSYDECTALMTNEEKAAYQKAYQLAHRDEIRQQKHQSYLLHPTPYTDEFRETMRRGRAARGFYHEWSRLTIYAHRMRGFDVRFSTVELARRALDTPNCEFCGKPLSWKFGNKVGARNIPTVDNLHRKHVLTICDVGIVCLSCNAIKNTRPLVDFVVYCRDQWQAHEAEAARLRVILQHMGSL